MTTSGVTIYQSTRDQIITDALRKLAVLAEGQTPRTQNMTDATRALNGVIALLRTKGMPTWARQSYTFTPTTNVYTIGVGQTLNTPYPVRLLQAIRNSSGAKIDMEIKAVHDFNILPANTTADPIIVSYSAGVNTGTLSLWPTPPAGNTSTITLVYQRPFEYSINSGDTFDFPEEWQLAITYQLAVVLAPEWSVPLQDRQMLKQEAKDFLDAALEGGQDQGSFYVQPERRM